MGKFTDHTGQKFNRLTAVARAANTPGGEPRWSCLCDCGKTVTVITSKLKNGEIKSCGCLRRERMHRHGRSRSHEYAVWNQMLQRCRNHNDKGYLNYGGRGITVDHLWNDFSVFFRDMGPAPPGTSIDRIDNNQGYRPDNCRWATRTEQNRNNRRVKLSMESARAIRADTRPCPEIAKAYGLSKSCVWAVKKGRAWRELPTDTPPAPPTT